MKKKIVLGIVAAAMAAPSTASAQVYTPPVCHKPVSTCEVVETVDAAAGLVVETACHFMWPTLYRLGWTQCPPA